METGPFSDARQQRMASDARFLNQRIGIIEIDVNSKFMWGK